MIDALALASLAPLLGVWIFRTHLPSGAAWLAMAFAVSFVGELAAKGTGGAWYPSYLWLPVQLGLVVHVVAPRQERIWWLTLLAALACYDMLAIRGPDVWVMAAGSVAVVAYAIRRGHGLAAPIVIYFGLGSAFYFGMVASLRVDAFWPWFWAYQASRVLAWLAFFQVLREHSARAKQQAARVQRDRETFGRFSPLVPVWLEH